MQRRVGLHAYGPGGKELGCLCTCSSEPGAEGYSQRVLVPQDFELPPKRQSWLQQQENDPICGLEVWPLWEYLNCIIWGEVQWGQAQIKRGKPASDWIAELTPTLLGRTQPATLRGAPRSAVRQREEVELWTHAVSVVSRGRKGRGREPAFRFRWFG